MTGLDLFAGCGGASIGLRAAGVEVVAAYDHDPRACRAHRALLPDVPVECVDLATLPALPAVDLWWASPPCQPFSSAGERRGAEDDRDGYPALLELVRRDRPRWLVIENVPGLRQHRGSAGCGALWPRPTECPGCYWRTILRALDELFAVVEVRLLDAADFGVPQHRERLITVCGPVRMDWMERTHGPGRERPWVSAGEALGLGGWLDTAQTMGHAAGRTPRVVPMARPAPLVRTDGALYHADLAIEHGGTASRDLYLSVGGPNARGGLGPSVTETAEPAPTVRPTADCYLVAAGATGEGRPSDLSDLSDPSRAVSGRGTMQLLDREYTRIRTLTVRERATLQSLPWDPTLTGRTVGNAVPPPLAEAVVRAVLRAEVPR